MDQDQAWNTRLTLSAWTPDILWAMPSFWGVVIPKPTKKYEMAFWRLLLDFPSYSLTH